MNENRLKIYGVRERNLFDFFTETTDHKIPDDATLVRTWQEQSQRAFYFMVRSDEFDPVKEGNEPPYIQLFPNKP
jgi:hypothetical protein